jgi:hypothetical protein
MLDFGLYSPELSILDGVAVDVDLVGNPLTMESAVVSYLSESPAECHSILFDLPGRQLWYRFHHLSFSDN